MDNSVRDFNVLGNQDISEIFRSQNCIVINIVRCNDLKESTSDISKIWDRYKKVVPPRTVGLSKRQSQSGKNHCEILSYSLAASKYVIITYFCMKH